MKTRYTILVEKSDNWWAVHVEGLPGALSQGRTLDEARRNIKEAIAMIVEGNGQPGSVSVQAADALREEVLVVTAPAQRASSKARRSRPTPGVKLATAGNR